MSPQLATHTSAHPGALRQSLPPPPLSDGTIFADLSVGWVRGEIVGFRGFHTEADAMAAIWLAHRALANRRSPRHQW